MENSNTIVIPDPKDVKAHVFPPAEGDRPVSGLPPHLLAEEVPEAKEPEEVFRHQWLYSVVPISSGVPERLNAYLTGFCRGCGRVFSQKIPTVYGLQYTETPMDVPQWGCADPTAGL